VHTHARVQRLARRYEPNNEHPHVLTYCAKMSVKPVIAVIEYRRLPIRSSVVDAVVCDLPFGVSCTTLKRNRSLYPRIARELARVTVSFGRVVLLVLHYKLMSTAFDTIYWIQQTRTPVNVGGLVCSILSAVRSSDPWVDYSKEENSDRAAVERPSKRQRPEPPSSEDNIANKHNASS
jgi:hypothetical protein